MLKRHSDHKAEVIGLLDVGTSKICCLIVERRQDPRTGALGGVRFLGFGHQRARGMKAGYVTDMDEAETSVRTAISQAEAAAGVTLEDLVLNITCGRMKSTHFCAHADLDAGYVRPADLDRLYDGASAYAERGGRAVVHLNRISYLLDGQPGVSQPLRMAGRRLSAQYHAVTVDEPALENSQLLVRRTLLGVRQSIPAGLASAVVVTSAEERHHGVIVVDIGEGTTDIAVMAEGRFMFAGVLPVGGGFLTYDLAKALMTPLAEAERIKTLYGTMLSADSNDQQTIEYHLAAGDDAETGYATRSEVRRIIYPRMLGQLRLLREQLDAKRAIRDADYSVVLTGEGSQLVGLPAIAADVLDRPVRLGQPRLEGGLPVALQSPAFATLVGMVAVAAPRRSAWAGSAATGRVASRSSWATVREWLAQSF